MRTITKPLLQYSIKNDILSETTQVNTTPISRGNKLFLFNYTFYSNNMDIQSIMIACIFLIIFALIVCHFTIHGSRRGKLIDLIPGPRWYPIIGNILDLVKSPEDLWLYFRRNGRLYYPTHKHWIGHVPVVNIQHPDDVEILLKSNKHIAKSKFYDFLHPWLNDGLLTSTGEKWKTRRKIITPAFHLNNLHEYSDIMIENTTRLIAQLKKQAACGYVERELLPMLSYLTLNTICESAMGTKLHESNPKENKYRRAVYDFGQIVYFRIVRPWLKYSWIFSLTSKGHEHAKILNTLHEFTTDIIKERKQYHAETNGKYLEDFSMSTVKTRNVQSTEKMKNKKKLAFIDVLISASKCGLGIDDEGIKEEVDTFVFEGHDTTATGLFFAILLLAEYPHVQTKAREEIDTVLKKNNNKMTINEVQQFNYLGCCIKETLRLYPSVPIVSRRIMDDLKLKHCTVSKGTYLNIQIYDLHRNPQFWPQPNVYDPDRFLPERIEGRHPFSYIPFSGGPRNCIGQKFALLELKTVIGSLLHNFYFEPLENASNVRIVTDLVLRPAHPVHIKFIPIVK